MYAYLVQISVMVVLMETQKSAKGIDGVLYLATIVKVLCISKVQVFRCALIKPTIARRTSTPRGDQNHQLPDLVMLVIQVVELAYGLQITVQVVTLDMS